MIRKSLLILLAAVLALQVGCDNQSSDLSSTVSPIELSPQMMEKGGFDLESLQYESLTAQIMPGVGGFYTMTMNSWPGVCKFSVQVPEGAIPASEGGGDQPVVFSLRVPNKQSYDNNPGLPLIVRLEPSGINFAEYITVYVYYMNFPPYNTAFPGGPLYWFETGEGEYAPANYLGKDRNGHRFMAKLPHFSDWDLGSGSVYPPPPAPPGE